MHDNMISQKLGNVLQLMWKASNADYLLFNQPIIH